MRSVMHQKERAAKLKILIYPNPVLSRISSPVGEVTDDIVLFAVSMIETLRLEVGAGLAAPQVGLLRRIIVIDTACKEKVSGGEIVAMIDPVIARSSGVVVDEEGCLSMPYIFTNIPRAKTINVRYTDLSGARREMEAEGFMARCIAHEIDHLDGILFWDRVSVIKRGILKIQRWRNRG